MDSLNDGNSSSSFLSQTHNEKNSDSHSTFVRHVNDLTSNVLAVGAGGGGEVSSGVRYRRPGRSKAEPEGGEVRAQS